MNLQFIFYLFIFYIKNVGQHGDVVVRAGASHRLTGPPYWPCVQYGGQPGPTVLFGGEQGESKTTEGLLLGMKTPK